MHAPQPLPTEPSPRWYQFQLIYLLYVVTLVAIAGTLLRPVIGFQAGWRITAAGTVYVALLTLYFGIRLPLLLRRYHHKRRALAAQQQELRELAAGLRRAPDKPGETE